MLEAHILLVLQRHCECPIYISKLLWVYNNNILMVGVSLNFCYLVVVFFILVIMSLDFCLIQCLCLHLMLCAYGKLFGKHSQMMFGMCTMSGTVARQLYHFIVKEWDFIPIYKDKFSWMDLIQKESVDGLLIKPKM